MPPSSLPSTFTVFGNASVEEIKLASCFSCVKSWVFFENFTAMGANSSPSIPSFENSGKALRSMLYAPFTSALIICPLAVLNSP
ncbi:MAG: hypothetical protein HWN65_06010 [Candidatus Helarchaeota archaeon]|nr:hypothetical protein [Candidatus Helarchaeota archaeon]